MDALTKQVMGAYAKQIKVMRIIHGGLVMSKFQVLKAEQMFVGYCRNEEFSGKSLDFINGMVFAKLSYKIPDDRMIELAREVRK